MPGLILHSDQLGEASVIRDLTFQPTTMIYASFLPCFILNF